MSSWADASDPPSPSPGAAPPAAEARPRERPRLQLKPRSAQAAAQASGGGGGTSGGGRSNPFGSAKPREQVLAQKGIDVRQVDRRVEARLRPPPRLTREQETQVDAARSALSGAERRLRDANERELPEGEFLAEVEKWRTELNALTARFAEANLSSSAGGEDPSGGGGGGGPPKFERPSERRKRLDQERRGGAGDESSPGGDDAFANFGGRTRRSGSGSGGVF